MINNLLTSFNQFYWYIKTENIFFFYWQASDKTRWYGSVSDFLTYQKLPEHHSLVCNKKSCGMTKSRTKSEQSHIEKFNFNDLTETAGSYILVIDKGALTKLIWQRKRTLICDVTFICVYVIPGTWKTRFIMICYSFRNYLR